MRIELAPEEVPAQRNGQKVKQFVIGGEDE